MLTYRSRPALFPAVVLLLVTVANAPAQTGPQQPAAPGPMSDTNIHPRGAFQNARLRFEKGKKGHVAFIGGSITEMNGYRPMVMEILQRRFPETEFTFTDAGIASTCSTTGAFRLRDQVLRHGPVDLFFVEFAVNDDQDAHHARRECIRGMEGIVRATRLHNPKSDIVITYFVNPEMLATCQAGKTPLSIAAHREVAEHYQIPTINLAQETADQITAGKLTWKQFGGTHPAPHGNAICAAMIDRLMTLCWSTPQPAEATMANHPLPEVMDANSYFRGRLIAPDGAKLDDGMSVQVPNWSKLKGSCRSRFSQEKLLCGEKPGAAYSLDFEGTAIGAFILAGPDAGIVETSVDGAPYKQINLLHAYSKGLHYPRTVMFETDLPPGKHTLRLRISPEKAPQSLGHALRVLYHVVN